VVPALDAVAFDAPALVACACGSAVDTCALDAWDGGAGAAPAFDAVVRAGAAHAASNPATTISDPYVLIVHLRATAPSNSMRPRCRALLSSSMRALILAATLAACVPPSYVPAPAPSTPSYVAAPAPSYAPAAEHTWVYVNGQELTVEQRLQLDALLGVTLPAGRYWVDAQGNAGVEGQPAQVNLYRVAEAHKQQQQQQQRGGKPVNIYSTDTAGRGSSMVSDGHCTIASTPDMTIATPGC
jgi:hypothetical protein